MIESDVTIDRTIVAFNRLGAGVEYDDPLTEVALECCDMFGNEGGDWVGNVANQLGLDGNFSADPLFCDLDESDYTLDANSPCLSGNHPDGTDCGLIGALGKGCGTTAVEPEPGPVGLRLWASSNPFHEEIRFVYRAPQTGTTTLSVFDLLGRRLWSKATRPGEGALCWDATTSAGVPVAPGTYFVQLETDTDTATKRILLLK